MVNKKKLYLIGLLITLSLVIMGIIIDPLITIFATLLMAGISYSCIRDILKKNGFDPSLLSESNRIKFKNITRSKLPILVMIPISIPLLILYSGFGSHNKWFFPLWIVISFTLMLLIDAVIYVYYFKYLLKSAQ